ncbi:LCP family protein [Nodosilinea sp. P-1105]|uniref:LCP family protein n=1 Tax=Nodosilinea sp. P-1105 TaxID=2546229 RepID=UPI00146C3CCB|nr:LCP family protein [Nodosilinea sp. P-1105]NMF83283.1 LytR family transcriptional regulator [Nodosilinea sp. P-1105]
MITPSQGTEKSESQENKLIDDESLPSNGSQPSSETEATCVSHSQDDGPAAESFPAGSQPAETHQVTNSETPASDGSSSAEPPTNQTKPPQPNATVATSEEVAVVPATIEVLPSEAPASHGPVKPKRSPMGKALRHFLWGGLFVGTALVSGLLGATAALMLPLPGHMGQSRPAASLGDLWKSGFRYQVTRPVNILVMGIDEVLDTPSHSDAVFAGRTDTLLLVRIDPDSQSLSVLSIPRDTRVQIPGHGTDKINQANAEGGAALAAQTIAYNLGDIPIDRYVRINTTAFREMVDLVGGIEVNVPKRMEYTDQTQQLYIDLYPGWQTLDGDQAEQFARYRNNTGDIGRVQRQQLLLRAFRERLTHPTVIPRLPQAVRVLQRYIDTNLTLEEMLALANFGLDIESNDLNMVMLPGRFSGPAEYIASYWLPDWDASADVLQTYFNVNTTGRYVDNSGVRSISNLRIAVQNASGDAETASAVASYLHDSGFRNVYVTENWSTVSRRTEVIAQRGDRSSAATVQSVIGVGRVLTESTGDLDSDITIRVGRDWAEGVPQEL